MKQTLSVELDALLIALYKDEELSPREITSKLCSKGMNVTFNQVGHRLGKLGILRSPVEEAKRHQRYKKLKTCPFCNVQFTGSSRKYCKTCVPNHEAGRIASTFGISYPEYKTMIQEQRGACAVCERDLATLTSKQIAVDHCHITDEVRGVVCVRCNTLLAALDTQSWLQKATYYVQHNQRVVPLWKRVKS